MKIMIERQLDMGGLFGCRRQDQGQWRFPDIEELEVACIETREIQEDRDAHLDTAAQVFTDVLRASEEDWKIVQFFTKHAGEDEDSLSRIAAYLKLWKSVFREYRVDGAEHFPGYMEKATRSDEVMVRAADGVYYVGALCVGLEHLREVLPFVNLEMPPTFFLTARSVDTILSDENVISLGRSYLEGEGNLAEKLLEAGDVLLGYGRFGGTQTCDVCSLAWKKGSPYMKKRGVSTALELR